MYRISTGSGRKLVANSLLAVMSCRYHPSGGQAAALIAGHSTTLQFYGYGSPRESLPNFEVYADIVALQLLPVLVLIQNDPRFEASEHPSRPPSWPSL